VSALKGILKESGGTKRDYLDYLEKKHS